MVQVLGVVVVVFSLLLVVGAITGRITIQSCCAPADPRRDARMAAAFEDVDTGATVPPSNAGGDRSAHSAASEPAGR